MAHKIYKNVFYTYGGILYPHECEYKSVKQEFRNAEYQETFNFTTPIQA